MSKYTKTVAATPDADKPYVSKFLKTNSKKHTGFGNIEDYSLSMPIDPTVSAGYSSEVITYAERLKYQHENGHSTQVLPDKFYLDYAQRGLNAKYNSMYDITAVGIDIAPDPHYAQYSYEEIIAMANNGVNIPKEVLAWAKGQQEADIIDYVVISDNIEDVDLNSQDRQNGESEVNKVRAEAKDYALKSKKAQEDIVVKNQKAEELTDKAADIAAKENSLFKRNSISKTEEMVKEWKSLDKKRKEEGKLSDVEKDRYKYLSNKLQKNGEIINELKLHSEELDDFLVSIDGLNKESHEGLSIAQKAMNAALNLSQLDEQINIFDRVHAYKIAATNSSLLANELNNITDNQLALVTDNIAHSLKNTGNYTIDNIRKDETQEVVTFARTYISKANYIEQTLGLKDESYKTEEPSEQETQTEVSEPVENTPRLTKSRSTASQSLEDAPAISETDLKEHIAKGVAMGQQPEITAFSYINSRAMKSAIQPEEKVTNSNSTSSRKTSEIQESANTESKKEKNVDPQAAAKDAYGSNFNFTAAFVGVEVASIVGLGPTAFAMQLLTWGGIVAASVADLYYKKGVVDNSSEVAAKDVQNSADSVKDTETKSKQILSIHNQNIAKAKALSNDYRELEKDSLNHQFEMQQNQAKLVESGRLNPEDIPEETLDPNARAKSAIRADISRMSENDAKILKTIDEPMSNSQKINKLSTKSVSGFEELNGKLSERSSNNNQLGDFIIGDVAIAQGLIIALMAVLAAGGMFTSGLLAAWALNLAKSIALAATGVAAKVVSNNVDGSIDKNNQEIRDDKKSLLDDDKKRLDVRKAMAKAGLEKMGNLPPEESEQNQTPQYQTKNSNEQEEDNSSQTYVRKDNDIRIGFDNSPLNADLDINNPNDLKIANQNAAIYTIMVNSEDENSKAAASTNTDTSSKADTTDKSDVKLARFNKISAISSKKKSQKVNAALASNNGRKRR